MTDELQAASPGAMTTARSIMAMGCTMDDELMVPDVCQVLCISQQIPVRFMEDKGVLRRKVEVDRAIIIMLNYVYCEEEPEPVGAL
jgi:hypothetical protein